jgi:hypothetical protein
MTWTEGVRGLKKKMRYQRPRFHVYMYTKMLCVLDMLSNKCILIELSYHFCEKPCASKSTKSTWTNSEMHSRSLNLSMFSLVQKL